MLFSQVMKGVGRNPKGDGKKKGGLKVYMLTDVHSETAIFAKISDAKMHDKKFLAHLNPGKGSMLVFDKAYNYYAQFADWTQEGVSFVCRLKDNAKAQLQDVLFEKTLLKDEFGVYKVEHIHLDYKKDKQEKTLCLRLVYYEDEKGRKFKFITINWEITAEEVAFIYKYRWTIELTIKKTETEFSVAFFLFRNGKQNKNTGLVYAYSTFAIECNSWNIKNRKSILNCGSTDQNTPDKSSVHKMSGSRRSKGIYSTQKGKKQKSYSLADKYVLRGGRFLKTQKILVSNRITDN